MPKQQLGLGGTISIGLASMLGAGVFVVFATAYQIASGYIFWALGLAALVATLNAAGIYQLARQVDRPGGVYAYSRVYVNDTVSFLSGFAFVFGKIASIAAIALVFQKYVFPSQPLIPSIAAIAVLTLINILGINRTAAVATVLSYSTTAFLAAVVVFAGQPSESKINDALAQLPEAGMFSVLTGAGVIFFAFAGYARVATLGNEVRDAKRVIPKAIVISMILVALLYFALAVVLLNQQGSAIAGDETPVATVFAKVTGNGWLSPLIAATAGLGSMLALLAGVSRTAATMAEDGELPRAFQKRNRFGSPWLAEFLIAAGAVILTSLGQIVWVIGFSSFSVLFYYAIGHLSALRQPASERLVPRWINVLGILLCAAISFSFGWVTLLVSSGILVAAWLLRTLWRASKTK
jgi:APA family basic amino acid/polyamine antiporter